MNTFTLLTGIFCISPYIPQAIGRSVEVVPISPTKPDISTSRIIEAFAVPPSAPEMWEDCSTNNSRRIKLTSGKADEAYRWKKGFFVQPDEAFTEDELELINDAMFELKEALCIPVKIWPPGSRAKGDYAFIRKSTSDQRCYSLIGRQGLLSYFYEDVTIINLGTNGCIHKHTIIHESIHAFGFDHEQNRPDRDDYIDLIEENIEPGKEHNFDLAFGSLTFDVPYDYKSIMHYPSYAFAIDKTSPTMLKKDGGKIGHNKELSKKDKEKLQAMYNCN